MTSFAEVSMVTDDGMTSWLTQLPGPGPREAFIKRGLYIHSYIPFDVFSRTAPRLHIKYERQGYRHHLIVPYILHIYIYMSSTLLIYIFRDSYSYGILRVHTWYARSGKNYFHCWVKLFCCSFLSPCSATECYRIIYKYIFETCILISKH